MFRMTVTESPLRKAVWAEMLSQVEKTVGAALSAARERERALEQFLHSCKKADTAPVSWAQELEDFLQRRNRLQQIAEQAGRAVAEVDAALAAEEKSLRHWLASTDAARTKLETWLQPQEQESGRG
jgi:ABC-type transporter Mla subunit MlaD